MFWDAQVASPGSDNGGRTGYRQVTIPKTLSLVLVAQVGRFEAFWSRLEAVDPGEALTDPTRGASGLALLGFFALWLGIPLGNMGQPRLLVRFMMAVHWVEIPALNFLIYELAPPFAVATLTIVAVSLRTERRTEANR